MARNSEDSACGERSRANRVNQGVEDHKGRGAVVYKLSAVFVSGTGVRGRVQKDEDADVDYDGEEHGEEDPEVVEPETFQ